MDPTVPFVRPATVADLPAAAALAARLIRFHHALDPARFLLVEPLEAGYQRFLARELGDASAVVLVAVDPPSRVVGYAYGRLEPRDWMALLDACGKLHDVFVDEAARGRGTGGRLVRAAVDALVERGAPRVVLSTAWGNHAARGLFGAIGFRPTMLEMTIEARRDDPRIDEGGGAGGGGKSAP